MSVGGGRYCRSGDVLSLAGRLLNAPSFHVSCDIGLGSDYSTRRCELKIQGFVSYCVCCVFRDRTDCTCPSIVHAAGVHFPSSAASHFGVSITAGANRCLY